MIGQVPTTRTTKLNCDYVGNFELILRLFQCFISHVTMSEAEIKLIQPLKLLQYYFTDIESVGKYS